MLDGKKTLFSGMQATGNLTLGNYLGALKNWVQIADDYQTFYSVVDMHSITVRQDPAELRKRARNLLTLYIAAGRMNLMMTDNEVETAWLKKTMVFMHEPLYRVIDKLERRFGVQIECTDGISLSDIYTGTFKDRNITDILDVLKMHYGFDYQIDDNQIKITHNN